MRACAMGASGLMRATRPATTATATPARRRRRQMSPSRRYLSIIGRLFQPNKILAQGGRTGGRGGPSRGEPSHGRTDAPSQSTPSFVQLFVDPFGRSNAPPKIMRSPSPSSAMSDQDPSVFSICVHGILSDFALVCLTTPARQDRLRVTW